jgi:hypothetical protein
MQETHFTPQPPIYTFRVRMLGCMAGYAPENAKEIQREIEIAANNTLGDLGFAILDAYDFDSDHLWSFFLSGKAWDRKSEYAYHGSDWDEDDGGFGDVMDLFPEGSEMRKLALLANDPAFEPTDAFPADIDPSKLLAEMVTMLNEAAADAPREERPLIEEFAQLLAADPNPDFTKMSEALQRYVSDDWEPDDLAGEPTPLIPEAELAGLDLAGFGFPFEEDDAPDVDEILIREVLYPGKTGKNEFLLLFDYGDEWHFGVKLLGTSDRVLPHAEYPRLTATRGDAPPQYPSWDDEDDEWDEGTDTEEAADVGVRSGVILRFDRKTGEVTRENVDIHPPANHRTE